ncbi:MAG: hypothetical protein K2J15_01025, partial [Muribaculaceae bacterium]|nr:hypothetical protein [Muribaculaceae bacterium]
MRNLLIIAPAVCLLSCLTASAALPESIIPSGYSNIDPLPNSIVDISANHNPLGVSTISFSYEGRELMINSSNTVPASLYFNDFTTPVDYTLRTSIDETSKTSAGVIFSGTYNQNGEYKIDIPAGMFLISTGADADGNPIGSQPLPAMTLYYEIDVPWTADPVNFMVEPELSRIVLTFDDVENLAKTKEFASAEIANRFNEPVPFTSVIEDNRLILTMRADGKDAPITAPGQYLLLIPGDAISFVKNGEKRLTDEIRLTYYVPSSPEPGIWPAPNEILDEGIEYFELTLPSGFEADSAAGFGFSINDRAVSYLYMADKDGNLDTSRPVALCKALAGESNRPEGLIYLGLFNPTTLEPLNFQLDAHLNSYGVPQSDLYSV